MLRLVAVLVALLSPAAALFAGDDGPRPHREHTPHADHAAWVALDFALPAIDSWVAVPLIAGDAGALVDVRYWNPGTDPSRTMHGVLFMTPVESAGGFGGMSAGWGETFSSVQVNFDGRLFECCNAGGLGAWMGGAGSSGNGSAEGITLAPGDTMWVTMVAAGADAKLLPVVEFRATEGAVTIGERRDGTEVHLVDLRDEAYANGRNVQLLGGRLGSAGDAAREWLPETNGLMFVSAWPHGAGAARLSVQAAGEEVFDDVKIAGETPAIVFAMGAGAYTVELTDLSEPPALPILDPSFHRVSAAAFYADIDVPGRGILAHHEE